MSQQLLRQLPQIEKLLQLPAARAASKEAPRSAVVAAVRGVVDTLRAEILTGKLDDQDLGRRLETESLEASFRSELERVTESAYGKVINATGIILHTGLGRAVLPPVATEAFQASLTGYSTVEVDRHSGERNQREAAVADLLTELTGAESATLVNNNAAATLIILACLARGREVIVSRGELVEIGGSFRIPDILRESGARLVEVGTTNRTYVRDYERAITPETGLLLQVHTSNYRIQGFTHLPSLEELVELGARADIPVASDLGSGCFVDLSSYGFEPEPLVADRVRAGADLVCFSGDKLLGGPQAGVIVGRTLRVKAVRAHPLYRAMRIDKTTLVLMEATLRCYRDPDLLAATVPTLGTIMRPADEIRENACLCQERLQVPGQPLMIDLVESAAQAGSGALPAQEIPSWALAIRHPRLSPEALARELRDGSPAVFSRIQNERVHLDFRTISPDELNTLTERLLELE